MRLFVVPILFGLLGVVQFLCAVSIDDFPDSLSTLNLPGLMVAFALIHGSQGAAGWIALVAGAAVQFVLFAVIGMLVAAASRVIFPTRGIQGQEAGG